MPRACPCKMTNMDECLRPIHCINNTRQTLGQQRPLAAGTGITPLLTRVGGCLAVANGNRRRQTKQRTGRIQVSSPGCKTTF